MRAVFSLYCQLAFSLLSITCMALAYGICISVPKMGRAKLIALGQAANSIRQNNGSPKISREKKLTTAVPAFENFHIVIALLLNKSY